MSDETYNGWTNRETWAVALHINNDQGWQESVHEALREATLDGIYRQGEYRPSLREGAQDPELAQLARSEAGLIIRENVEAILDPEDESGLIDAEYAAHYVEYILPIRNDIGSLWRVNWSELGASFLEDLEEAGDTES